MAFHFHIFCVLIYLCINHMYRENLCPIPIALCCNKNMFKSREQKCLKYNIYNLIHPSLFKFGSLFCSIVCCFRTCTSREFFTHMKYVIIAGEGLQISTNAQPLYRFSSCRIVTLRF